MPAREPITPIPAHPFMGLPFNWPRPGGSSPPGPDTEVCMTLILQYPSKKALKTQVGKKLDFVDPSPIAKEYTPNGVVFGSNRPHLTGYKTEFFAKITIKDGIIAKVE